MSEPVQGLIVGHASLAAGLVDAVRQIAGDDADGLRPLSNAGCGPDALLDAVRREAGSGPALVFTDLASGSCAFAAHRLIAERPDTAVLFGANLAVVLDFVFHRHLPLPNLVERLATHGREAIRGVYGGERANAGSPASGR